MPSIGLVKFIAPDNSHGYLLEIQKSDLSSPSARLLRQKGNIKFRPPKNQDFIEGDILRFEETPGRHEIRWANNPTKRIIGIVAEILENSLLIFSEIGTFKFKQDGRLLSETFWVELNFHINDTKLTYEVIQLNEEKISNQCLSEIASQAFRNASTQPSVFISLFNISIQSKNENFLQRLGSEWLTIPATERLKSISAILKSELCSTSVETFLKKHIINNVPEEIVPLYAEGLIESSEIETWLTEKSENIFQLPVSAFRMLMERLSTNSNFKEIAIATIQYLEGRPDDERVQHLLRLLSEKLRDLLPGQWMARIFELFRLIPISLQNKFWEQNEQVAERMLSDLTVSDFLTLVTNNSETEIATALWDKKWQIEIRSIPICVLDLEIRWGKINQIAWILNQEEKIFAGDEITIRQGLLDLQDLFENDHNIILSGHNIREFDLPELNKHIGVPESVPVLDTLEIVAICNPTLSNYQLRTEHNALEDCRLTHDLLRNCLNDLLVLDESIWVEVRLILPQDLVARIEPFRGKVLPLVLPTDKYFQQGVENMAANDIIARLETLLGDGQLHLLTSLEHRGWLTRQSTVIFQTPADSWDNILLVANKISAVLTNKQILKAALLSFVNESGKYGRPPLLRLLSPWLRRQLIDKLGDPLQLAEPVNPSTWKGIICWEPMEFLEKSPRLDNVIALSPKLFTLSGVKLFAKYSSDQLDTLSKQYWMRFAGNNGRAPLEKSEAESLLHFEIGNDFDVFWLERLDASNEVLLWGSLSSRRWLQFLERSNIKAIDYENTVPSFSIASVNDIYLNQASINRLNPDSPYRAPYWLLQTRLLDSLFAKERMPVLLALKGDYEVERLSAWLRNQGWYIPDERLSIFRKFELLHTNLSYKRLLPFTINELPTLLEANYLAPVIIVIDSLDLRPWQFASNESTRPIIVDSILSDTLENEDEGDNDIESTDEGEASLEHFDLHGMVQQIYPWMDWLGKMVLSFNSKNQLVFLDARLEDHIFPKYFKPGKLNASLPWKNQEVYLQDLERILPYFPQINLEEESDIFENCKNAIETALLGGNHLYDYQEDYLRSIAKRQQNLVISLPTGGGKSILFQGPALFRGSKSYRLTLVITPLKALMEDQVEGLWRKKFWACVDAISSDMTQAEVRHVLRRVAGGEILLLYLTPERFRSRSFIRSFINRLTYDKDLEYCVFDEAHCISQWGNEFRPAYLSAARTVRNWQNGRQLPCLFLSATISEQVYRDIQHIFNGQPKPADHLAITRLQNQEFYNPIRDHIQLTFKEVNHEGRIEAIANYLKEHHFEPSLSRALVFVNSRRETEELAEEFESHVKGKVRAGFFHAGMSSGDREEVFESFKSGDVALLFATKAFGMGMDVPNIHFVFHYEPSSTIEDFLQEVGRAGRDPKSLASVNFSKDRPLTTVCLYESDDFGKLFDRIQNSSIAWEDIRELQKLLLNYFQRIQYPQDRPAPVSERLFNQSPTLKDNKNKKDLISLGLHWLEKLGRFKTGMYTPDAFEFDATKLSNPTTDNPDLNQLLVFLNDLKEQNAGCLTVLASSVEVAKLLKVQPGDSTELFRQIFLAQKKGLLYLKNDLSINLVKGKGGFRLREITNCIEQNTPFPGLEAAKMLQEKIWILMRTQDAVVLSGEEIDRLVKPVLDNEMRASRFTWIESENRENFAEIARKQFSKNKVKYAVSILGWFDKVKHRSKMKEGQSIQTFVLDRVEKESLKQEMSLFQQQCQSLLRLVYKGYIAGQGLFDWHWLLDQLKIDDISRLEMLLIYLKRMGYVHFEGSAMPFAIEVYQTETSTEPIDHRNPQSADCRVYEDEYLENQKLRVLRLAALQTLAHLTKEQGRVGADAFIQQYFTCQSAADVIELLEQNLHERHPVLQAIKEEALQFEENRLHESQRKVYEADIQRNLNVIAGPGSGKTHTLVLRVAKLIHRERVAPGQILVLAYNRAVVTELKDRLAKLFARLGYKNLIKGLRIFTFHGLMKYCLQERADGLEPNEFAALFIRTYDHSPGEIRARLGNIRFVMVDEFQDITSERLEILKRIAPAQSVTVTVIGDPDQSIYGYERAKLRQPVPPKPYYEEFEKSFTPDILELTVNYRSYPQIVEEAKRLLSLNPIEFPVSPLTFFQSTPLDWPYFNHYTEVLDADSVSWESKLLELLEEKTEKGKSYSQIGLMFRTNNEVFRAYGKVNQLNLPTGVRVRIQGSSANFNRLREVHEFLLWIHPFLSQILPLDFIQRFRNDFISTRSRSTWDNFTLHTLEAIIFEFLQKEKQESSTYSDLARFIDEFAWRDDGQLNKIYQLHREEIAKYHADVARIEVILTTMHRVKGLEYDAVLIPPSYYNLSVNPAGNMSFEDLLYEERRLWYVAMTRAKKRLVWIKWQREEALINGNEFLLPPEYQQRIGIGFEDGIDKINIGFLPSLEDASFQIKNTYIEQNIRTGDAVKLMPTRNGGTSIQHKGQIIGLLKRGTLLCPPNGLSGYIVTNVLRYTYEDCLDYDRRHLGSNFSQNWNATARELGYINIVDFAGYGR